MEEPRRVMICRKVVGTDGVARVVLEPAQGEPNPIQTQQPINDDDDNSLGGDTLRDVPPHEIVGGKSPKPFIQCEICGKKFYVTDTTYKRTPKERLTLHIVTEHDRERLYQCDSPGCFKAYNNVKQLNQHRLVHTNKKNHKCPECPKRFHRKTHLLAHMRRHTANPNFRPRASRRQCNPYIQVQRKKNGQLVESEQATTAPAVVTQATATYQFIEADSSSGSMAAAGTTMIVVTEDELEQMRRLEGEVIDRDTVMVFDSVEGCEQLDEDEGDEAELEESDEIKMVMKSDRKAGGTKVILNEVS